MKIRNLNDISPQLRQRIERQLEADAAAGGSRKAAKLECPAIHAPLEASQSQKGYSGRVHVRFVSVRKRLLDPDNLSCKWLLDSLRFAGILRGDEPDKITLQVEQRKAAKGEAEHTVIEIFDLSP